MTSLCVESGFWYAISLSDFPLILMRIVQENLKGNGIYQIIKLGWELTTVIQYALMSCFYHIGTVYWLLLFHSSRSVMLLSHWKPQILRNVWFTVQIPSLRFLGNFTTALVMLAFGLQNLVVSFFKWFIMRTSGFH